MTIKIGGVGADDEDEFVEHDGIVDHGRAPAIDDLWSEVLGKMVEPNFFDVGSDDISRSQTSRKTAWAGPPASDVMDRPGADQPVAVILLTGDRHSARPSPRS